MKKEQKHKKYGYALFVKRPEDKSYSRVGFLFHHSDEAVEYRERKYGDVENWIVEAVRLNTEKVGLRNVNS